MNNRGGEGGIADGSAPALRNGDGDADPSNDDAMDLAISTLNDAKMATTAEAKVR